MASSSKDFKNKLKLFYLEKLALGEHSEEFSRFYDESFEQFLMKSNTGEFNKEDLLKVRNILTYEKEIIKGIAI